MDKLVLLAGYLQIHRLASAAAHVTEANNLLTATEEQAELVMNQIHAHEPAAGQGAAWAQAHGVAVPHATAKPTMALKPDKLSFDANLGALRRWKQRFAAFHSSSNFRILPITDQQASSPASTMTSLTGSSEW